MHIYLLILECLCQNWEIFCFSFSLTLCINYIVTRCRWVPKFCSVDCGGKRWVTFSGLIYQILMKAPASLLLPCSADWLKGPRRRVQSLENNRGRRWKEGGPIKPGQTVTLLNYLRVFLIEISLIYLFISVVHMVGIFFYPLKS